MFKFKNWLGYILDKERQFAEAGTPTCPQCGGRLVKRNSNYGEFWGCSNFRNGCRGKLTLLQYQKKQKEPEGGTTARQPQQPVRRQEPRQEPPRQQLQRQQPVRRQQQQPDPEPQEPDDDEPTPARADKLEWYYAQAIKSHSTEDKSDYFSAGVDLALLPLGNGSWTFRVLSGDASKAKSGVLSKEEVAAGAIKAYRDETKKDAQGKGTPLTSDNPTLEDLYEKLGKPIPTDADVDPQWIEEQRQKHTIPLTGKNALSEEQKAIDAKFDEVMRETQQSHIMIDAKAGTGKTTMLKHLAWKYGKPGERWLYLVFNTKNKVEAKGKFPPWVHVATTNGFLGEVMNLPQNYYLQTKRVSTLKKKFGKAFDKDEKVSKSELLANGDQFIKILKGYQFPVNVAAAAKRAGQAVGFDEQGIKILQGFIERSILDFQKNVITFVGLAKSYAIDPRKSDLQQELHKIYDSYGPLPQDPAAGNINATMAQVKAGIQASKSERWKAQISQALSIVFGRDYMSSNYETEMFQCVEWMLKKTMPPSAVGATDEKVHVCGNSRCGDVWVGDPKCPECGGTQLKYSFPLKQYRDFNDDFWFPAIFANEENPKKQVKFPKYDYILADEVQDFNECQKIILVKLHEQGAKIVAVGDPFQGIYRFRGADAQAFKNLGHTLGELSHNKDVIKTLTKNFRSRKNPLDWVRQNTIVKELEQGKHTDDEYQGDTSHMTVKYEAVFTQLGQEMKSGGMKKQTAFIARTNEPLAHAALKLLVAGIPFVIIGKDIAGGLKRHIKTITNSKWVKNHYPLNPQDHVEKLKEKAQAHLEQETNKYRKVPVKQAYLKNLDEISNALIASIGQFLELLRPKPPEEGQQTPNAASWNPPDTTADETIEKFTKWIGAKLGGLDWESADEEGNEQQAERDFEEYQKKLEDKNTVILTTAHKSKGLEYERVYVLRFDQFPHPKAKRPEDKEQEENAKYVTGTRAMDELHIVQLDGQPGYNK